MGISAGIFLDHFQSEQFSLYWRCYPEIGLNEGLFYNLLLYDRVGVSVESFHPEEGRRGDWRDAYDHFLQLEKLDIVDLFSPEYARAAASGAVAHLNLSEFKDVFIYDYCVRNDVPLGLSKYRARNIEKIVACALKALHRPTVLPQVSIQPEDQRSQIARWLIDLEIPGLSVRNEQMRKRLYEEYSPNAVVRKMGWAIEADHARWQMASLPKILQDNIFIAPEELTEIFADGAIIREIASKVGKFAERIATKAQLADNVKNEYEELNAKLGSSGLVFSGINLAFCWAPFASLVTVPAEKLLNHYIRRSRNWLLFLNSVNRRIRTGRAGGPAFGGQAGGA